MSDPLFSLINTLRDHAAHRYQRRLLVLSGEQAWGEVLAAKFSLGEGECWVADSAPEGVYRVAAKQAGRLLGRTFNQLVFNGWHGLNPNALGQSSGTLKGGGLLILICPPLDNWHQYDDPENKALAAYPYRTIDVGKRFLKYFITQLQQNGVATIVQQNKPLPQLPFSDQGEASDEIVNVLNSAALTPTSDQQRTIQAIFHAARNRRQPLVITADRGRGKSAALGMAAAALMKDGQKLMITAPSYAAVEEVFHFARASLPTAESRSGFLAVEQGELSYFEPEQLVRKNAEGIMLLVDEAAAIPAPMLALMLEKFNRVVFSTTIHGYEGTGRGFSVRFKQKLDQRTPRWRSISLTQPVRWAKNDPLERFIYQALLLNAEAVADEKVGSVDLQAVTYHRLSRDKLLQQPGKLSELFGLLVLAHYRTAPGDLRIMLDAPNLSVWVAEVEGVVIGCVLVADEGPLDSVLAEAVWAGQRRPPGHLLPQTLVAQSGCLAAAPLRCARIMRIAVHPAIKRSGIGLQMLSAVAEDATQRRLDYIGASFSVTADLLPFWMAGEFQPVRVGLTRDAVSGSYAVLLCRALSADGMNLMQQLRARFSEQFPELVYIQLADMERELVPLLLQDTNQPKPNAQDWLDLKGFAHYNRNLDSSRFALRKLVLWLFSLECHPQDDRYIALMIELLLAPQLLKQQQTDRKWLTEQLRLLTAECLSLIEEKLGFDD